MREEYEWPCKPRRDRQYATETESGASRSGNPVLEQIKRVIVRKTPWLVAGVRSICHKLYLPIRHLQYSIKILYYRIRYSDESVFRVIHRTQGWSKSESVSGAGSSLSETIALRQALPELIQELGIRSIVDAPCGDFHWMSKLDLDLDRYVGVDIVPELIEENRARHATRKIRFTQGDLTRDDIECADLIICRDCLVHLSYTDIFRCLKTFERSGSKYLLTTTYPGLTSRNWNIVTGMWRPIDLELPPFRFPLPLRLLSEESTTKSDYQEKSLGLWRVKDLPL